MIRDDLSNKLVHLTKGAWENAADTFKLILNEKILIGSPGGIKSRDNCICFSEAPLSKLSQILANRNASNFRYAPFGVMVSKKWLFSKGGRPVIYQPTEEYDFLPEQLKWRHQLYDPVNEKDYTWEREWRIKVDQLELDPLEATVIVPNRAWESKILSGKYNQIQRATMVSLGPLPKSMIQNPWHFIVLEDLGVSIPEE